jgi:hypothetical protein
VILRIAPENVDATREVGPNELSFSLRGAMPEPPLGYSV